MPDNPITTGSHPTKVDLFGEDEVAPGQLREAVIGGVSLVIVRKRDGSFRALRNRCMHEGAPLAGGKLHPLVIGPDVGVYAESDDRDVLECPWHGYEYDLDTGRSPADPVKVRVRSYDVSVENHRVILNRPGGIGESPRLRDQASSV